MNVDLLGEPPFVPLVGALQQHLDAWGSLREGIATTDLPNSRSVRFEDPKQRLHYLIADLGAVSSPNLSKSPSCLYARDCRFLHLSPAGQI